MICFPFFSKKFALETGAFTNALHSLSQQKKTACKAIHGKDGKTQRNMTLKKSVSTTIALHKNM